MILPTYMVLNLSVVRCSGRDSSLDSNKDVGRGSPTETYTATRVTTVPLTLSYVTRRPKKIANDVGDFENALRVNRKPSARHIRNGGISHQPQLNATILRSDLYS